VETRQNGIVAVGEVNAEFASVFARLRAILHQHAGTLSVKSDTADYYCLEAGAGPAAVRAWRGEMRKPMIPVGWVQIGKAYVSYHLMSVYGNHKLLEGMSKELKARMQGKTCFNFKSHDEALFQELERLTGQSLAAFKKAGFISAQKS
jgi:hypothetical protein